MSYGQSGPEVVPAVKARSPIFFGWWVVGVCVLVTAMRAGLGTQTLGFLIEPMQLSLGATATAVTSAIAVQHAVAAGFAPLVGKLLDKFGGRVVVTVGAACDGLSLIMMSQVTSIWQFALVMGLLGGFAEACVGNPLLMPFISKWFVKRRGIAIGIVSTGANLGGVIFAPIIVALTVGFGWRGAWFMVGLIPLLLVAPLAWFVLRGTPESIGSVPDGKIAHKVAGVVEEVSYTVRETLKTPAFWFLLMAWNLVDFAAKGALLNKIPYGMELGFTAAEIAGLITIFGLASIVGKLMAGYIADRISPIPIASGLALAQATGLYLFVDSHDPILFYASYGLMAGFASGGLIALMPLILADFFGRKHQGAIGGIATPFLLISSVGGPIIAPWFADMTGSYGGGFLAYAASSLVGGIVVLLVRKPSRKAEVRLTE